MPDKKNNLLEALRQFEAKSDELRLSQAARVYLRRSVENLETIYNAETAQRETAEFDRLTQTSCVNPEAARHALAAMSEPARIKVFDHLEANAASGKLSPEHRQLWAYIALDTRLDPAARQGIRELVGGGQSAAGSLKRPTVLTSGQRPEPEREKESKKIEVGGDQGNWEPEIARAEEPAAEDSAAVSVAPVYGGLTAHQRIMLADRERKEESALV